ncbi:MAG: PAS domain-containing protein [Planctomycetes bacterium]|nr:PAS domain-containing protein [Planctomycetota bacterium]
MKSQLKERRGAIPRLREALRTIRRDYPRLLATVPDVVWVGDRDGNTVFISPNVERVYGYTPQEIYAAGDALWFGRIHPDDVERVKGAYDSLFTGRQRFDCEYRIQRKDGRWIWIHDRALAVHDASEGACVYGLFSDVTERKRAEALLEGQNRVLERIATGAPLEEALSLLALAIEEQSDGLLCSILLLLDEDRKRLLHGAAPSLPAEHCRAVHGLALGPAVGSCGTAAFTGKRVIVTDIAQDPLWSSCKELGLRHGLRACWSQPIFSSKGEVTGTFAMYYREPRAPSEGELRLIEKAAHLAGVAIEHHRTAEALKVAKEGAEAASRFKSSFLAAMSHEVRTPMTAILGYADLLLDPNQTPEERAGSIQVIRQNGAHLLAILNDILDLSKIEAGKLEVERIPCSPAAVVEEVRSLLNASAKEKGLELSVEYLTPVPEEIRSDPTRLRQILLNLVGNAIKFTEAGTVLLAVSLLELPDPEEARLCFEVVDSGPGLTEEQRKGLFQAYAQAGTWVARTHAGTGLGLAISRRLARLLGGDIAVQSTLGEGSSFLLKIDPGPLDRGGSGQRPRGALAAEPQGAGAAQPEREAAPRLSGRVLLAEDVVVNQKLIAFHLRKAGLEVEIAGDGRTAVDRVLEAERAGEPFDLVFMDMHMPVLDGLGAVGELRAKGYAGPIVALTASALRTERERCLRGGCTAFLSKPIERRLLLEAAARYVRKG